MKGMCENRKSNNRRSIVIIRLGISYLKSDAFYTGIGDVEIIKMLKFNIIVGYMQLAFLFSC